MAQNPKILARTRCMHLASGGTVTFVLTAREQANGDSTWFVGVEAEGCLYDGDFEVEFDSVHLAIGRFNTEVLLALTLVE